MAMRAHTDDDTQRRICRQHQARHAITRWPRHLGHSVVVGTARPPSLNITDSRLSPSDEVEAADQARAGRSGLGHEVNPLI